LLIAGSFFAIIYNFNIPALKKRKWFISIPLSIPLAIVSNIFFPLVASSPPWLIIEIALLSPLGAIYSSFVYEKAVLHMGDYRTRMRRFLEQTERGKKGGPSLPVEKEGFAYFTYGLLGRRIGKLLGIFGGLKEVLSLAGIKIGFKAYVSSMVFAAMLGGGISFFVWFLILNLGLGSALGLSFTITSILLEVVLSIALAVMTGVVILGVFYMLPYMKVGSRRNRLDQFLPFTSSYMTVLASAGVTPERILRSTAEKDPKFMLSEDRPSRLRCHQCDERGGRAFAFDKLSRPSARLRRSHPDWWGHEEVLPRHNGPLVPETRSLRAIIPRLARNHR
jgi:hypothetical protein